MELHLLLLSKHIVRLLFVNMCNIAIHIQSFKAMQYVCYMLGNFVTFHQSLFLVKIFEKSHDPNLSNYADAGYV